mmetsp:Transcript_57931/g.126981  ORF Transcript_57931/g.126981 Transcript_57931/m.126981 type:complete len:211 (+) Transcript_57931:1908-2540(+)
MRGVKWLPWLLRSFSKAFEAEAKFRSLAKALMAAAQRWTSVPPLLVPPPLPFWSRARMEAPSSSEKPRDFEATSKRGRQPSGPDRFNWEASNCSRCFSSKVHCKRRSSSTAPVSPSSSCSRHFSFVAKSKTCMATAMANWNPAPSDFSFFVGSGMRRRCCNASEREPCWAAAEARMESMRGVRSSSGTLLATKKTRAKLRRFSKLAIKAA